MQLPTPAPDPKPSSPFSSWRGDHTGLRVTDLDAAIAWYTQTLDFRVMQTMPFGALSFTFVSPPTDDSFRLELLAGPGASAKPGHGDLMGSLGLAGWHHVCWRVDSVDDAVAELKRRGVAILNEPTDNPAIGRRIAFFADPWGNVFELTQPMKG